MQTPGRNLALEFVRVTEEAAIAAARWVGKGDRKGADKAATDAMRTRLNAVDFDGLVVSGEGRKDDAPMLFDGEKVGTGSGEQIDLAVDPLECTDSVANGRWNATTVIAGGPRHGFLASPDIYMEKIAVGPRAAGHIDLRKSVKENITNVAKALGKPVDEVTVVVLDRPRHEKLIGEIRECGACVVLITDGDVAGGIAPAMPNNPIDILLGIGAGVEGVQAAIALKCLGGEFQGRYAPKDDEQRARAEAMGITDFEKVYQMDDLVFSDDVFFVASGVIEGPMLQGARFTSGGAVTHSVVMRARSKTVRFIEAVHRFN
jgi:fructose-1,6-bisphosphatase II